MRLALAIAVSVLVAALALAAVALPRRVYVARRVVVDAPPELIWADVGNLASWPEWTDWSSRTDAAYDPKLDGTTRLTWTKSEGGSGSQTITQGDPSKGLAYRRELRGGALVIKGRVLFSKLNKEGTRTAVEWIDEMDFAHSYRGRYYGAVADTLLGPRIERSLLALKSRSEERARGVAPAPPRPQPVAAPPGEAPMAGPEPAVPQVEAKPVPPEVAEEPPKAPPPAPPPAEAPPPTDEARPVE